MTKVSPQQTSFMTTSEHFENSIPEYDDPDQLALFDVEDSKEQDERIEYKILDDIDLRYRYVRYTEGLIARAIKNDIDSMIFLDKSARPVAWLMRSLWPTLGIKDFTENGEPIMAEMPDMKFINFDREQWQMIMGRSEVKEGPGISINRVPDDVVDQLTGLFAEKSMDYEDLVSREDKTLFDDKKVLIVDEVKASGDTLTMAELMMRRAFQNAESIEGAYWMTPETKRDRRSGGMRNANVPVWYMADTAYGRLVGDRSSVKSRESSSKRQRRGAVFLSTKFPDIDEKGVQLRHEMYQLGKDVANGEIPVAPGKESPDSDEYYENFIQYVNDLSVKEFGTLRRQAENENVPFATLVNKYKDDAHAAKLDPK